MKVHLFKFHASTIIALYIFSTFALIFIVFYIQPLLIRPISPSPQSQPNKFSWTAGAMHKWQAPTINTSTETPSTFSDCSNYTQDLRILLSKLEDSVTFLPLKDLRYSTNPQKDHTWFMSSLNDSHEQGEVQYQRFPWNGSEGRLLCVKGRDSHDGSWNSYGLAWPEALPHNATLYKGLTFVSYNHYNYDNIWHGLSAMVPFVAWHLKNGCTTLPTRWVLYHWGELRTEIRSPWLMSLMEAAFGTGSLYIEDFDEINNNNNPACFEDAVVMRHNEGGMSRKRRTEVYDLLRCKARVYCKVIREDRGEIGMTMLMRAGARSFKNDSTVIDIFEKECKNVEGCRLRVAYSNNLSFCQQVNLMSSTDILLSPHGAQLTNMFLMDKNSSVMEFFPFGWLKHAGVGQYVYQWIANWSGMIHQGAWRDTRNQDHNCPFPEDDRRCMSVYKSAKIGGNRTYFSVWARRVLQQVKLKKAHEEKALPSPKYSTTTQVGDCTC